MLDEEIRKQTHKLYCPKCDKDVLIPYATEISCRHCPECNAGAETLWPTKPMYERDCPKPVAAPVVEKAEAPIPAAAPQDDGVLERVERKFGFKKK